MSEYEYLKDYYFANISHETEDIKKIHPRNHVEFQQRLKEATSWIDEGLSAGEVTFAIRMKCVISGVSEYPQCAICDNRVSSVIRKRKWFSPTCSRACQGKLSLEKVKETNQKKWGVDNVGQVEEIKERIAKAFDERYDGHPMYSDSIKTKQRETLRERTGYDNPMKNPMTVKKAQSTNLVRWGSASPSQNPIVQEKVRQTNMKNFGVPYAPMSDSVKKKSMETNMRVRGVLYPMQCPEVVEKSREAFRRRTSGVHDTVGSSHIPKESMMVLRNKEKLEELVNTYGPKSVSAMIGVSDVTVYNYLNEHEITHSYRGSQQENEVKEYIESLGFATSKGTNFLGRQEIDILIEGAGVGIEYNGLFYHSEDRGRGMNYHLQKTKEAADKGVRLLHIFSDEWMSKKDIVKKKIASILGVGQDDRIFARKTEFCAVPRRDADEFMENNHIQGKGSFSSSFGLKDKDTGRLIACMMVKKTANDGEYDITRYATSCSVVGGFSKLLTNIKKEIPDMERVISFADLRYSTGELYRACGFELEKITPPNYSYVSKNGHSRLYKGKFRLEKMKKMEEFIFDPAKSERDNMAANGYFRIWDCGLMKFVKEL